MRVDLRGSSPTWCLDRPMSARSRSSSSRSSRYRLRRSIQAATPDSHESGICQNNPKSGKAGGIVLICRIEVQSVLPQGMSHLHDGARQRLATEAHRAVVDGPRRYFYHTDFDCSSGRPLYSRATCLILLSGTSRPPHQLGIPFKCCSPFFWSVPVDGLPLALP